MDEKVKQLEKGLAMFEACMQLEHELTYCDGTWEMIKGDDKNVVVSTCSMEELLLEFARRFDEAF